MFAAQAERAARAAAEAEDRSLNGKLYEARRRSEALEEELQVSCKDHDDCLLYLPQPSAIADNTE